MVLKGSLLLALDFPLPACDKDGSRDEAEVHLGKNEQKKNFKINKIK